MGCSSSKDEEEQQHPIDLPGSNDELVRVPLKDNQNSRHESNMNRKASLLQAEKLFKETSGRRFYDSYVRPTLVSYGGSCKVLTAFHKETQKKVCG